MHLHQTTTNIKLQQNSHPKCSSLLHLQQQTLTLKHNVLQATMEAYELKFQALCSSKFQQNNIVIKPKGDDLNNYQSKKGWQHCHKDLMWSNNINFFMKKL